MRKKVAARCNVDKQHWDNFELPQVETSTIMCFGHVMMEQVNTQDTAGRYAYAWSNSKSNPAGHSLIFIRLIQGRVVGAAAQAGLIQQDSPQKTCVLT